MVLIYSEHRLTLSIRQVLSIEVTESLIGASCMPFVQVILLGDRASSSVELFTLALSIFLLIAALLFLYLLSSRSTSLSLEN